MQGNRGGAGDADRGRGRGRGRGQQGDALGPADYVLAGATAVAVGYCAYKLHGALFGSDEVDNRRVQTVERQMPESNNWFTGWFNRINFHKDLGSFWRNVEETQNEERAAIHSEVFQYQMQSAIYKNKYNKFDCWFQNLLGNILHIDNDERKLFVQAFEEILEVLLEEMGEVDPLFKYMYRTFAPAGSSWEELRICTPDEFDVNIILLPTNIQENVRVEDVGSGHIAIRLDKGFDASENKVSRKLKLNNDLRPKAQYESIQAQLRNWMENSYVSRMKVLRWMQSVVDSALQKLRFERHQWTHVKDVSRSTNGPAVTINAVMKNGKLFSIDLVPAFEFSQEHLPDCTRAKVRSRGVTRTWYGIPKGPTKQSSSKMWRTSLYEAERDIMRGHNHSLKPCIRIIKRLRDMQEWKALSSYYIKTMFMWMMEDKKLHLGLGLGQTVMVALKELQNALRNCQIKYYWDENLNLLDNGSNRLFFGNTSGHLSKIIREFERSVVDDNINPMAYFGCDKEGKPFSSRTVMPESKPHSPSRPNEECVLM